MDKFKNFDHFRNYCIRAHERKNGVKASIKIKGYFLNLEHIWRYLVELKENNYTTLKLETFLKRAAYLFIYEGEDVFYALVDELLELKTIGDTSELIRVISVKLRLTASMKNKLPIPQKMGMLHEDVRGIQEILNVKGLYFIYDNNRELAYIGKSLACVFERSKISMRERELLDSPYIEYRIPKTESDIGIYEMYYINKLKPYKNKDIVLSDSPTIILPEIENIYVVDKDFKVIMKKNSFGVYDESKLASPEEFEKLL